MVSFYALRLLAATVGMLLLAVAGAEQGEVPLAVVLTVLGVARAGGRVTPVGSAGSLRAGHGLVLQRFDGVARASRIVAPYVAAIYIAAIATARSVRAVGWGVRNRLVGAGVVIPAVDR